MCSSCRRRTTKPAISAEAFQELGLNQSPSAARRMVSIECPRTYFTWANRSRATNQQKRISLIASIRPFGSNKASRKWSLTRAAASPTFRPTRRPAALPCRPQAWQLANKLASLSKPASQHSPRPQAPASRGPKVNRLAHWCWTHIGKPKRAPRRLAIVGLRLT